MTLLNFFQSAIDLEVQYIFSLVLHSLFHYALECLVILTGLEYLFQRESDKDIYSYIAFSNSSISEILNMLIFPL